MLKAWEKVVAMVMYINLHCSDMHRGLLSSRVNLAAQLRQDLGGRPVQEVKRDKPNQCVCVCTCSSGGLLLSD